MPRPRITEQEKRERALMRAIGAAKGELGLTYDTQVAEMLGISKSQYCHLKKDRFHALWLKKKRVANGPT